MQILSNEEFKCYETTSESLEKNGRQIALDGKTLIRSDSQDTERD